MFGSTAVPWFIGGPLSVTIEDFLSAAFAIAGLALFIVAYDYQVSVTWEIDGREAI